MHRRLFGRALIAALVLVLAVTGTALAARRGTSTPNIWMTMGAWGGWANFTATWEIVPGHSEGQSYWSVAWFEMTGLAINGKDCPSDYCVSWTYAPSARFINSSGTQVGATLYPGAGGCQDHAYSTRSRFWANCRRLMELPASVNRVKLHWVISVKRRDGFLFSWVADKTVPIY